MGAELPEGGVVKGKDVHAWVEVQDDTGTWIPLLQNTFLPDRNQKPNQLQSKTDEQKIGALVPPPAGTNPPSVLQGPDQAQNAVNLKKPPKKLFDPSAWPTWLRWLVFYVLLPLLALVALYWLIRGAKAWRRRRHATRGTGDGPRRVGVGRPDEQRPVLRPRPARAGPPGSSRRRRSAGSPAAHATWPRGRTRSSSDPGTPEVDDARGLLAADQRGARRPAGQLRLLAPAALRRRPAAAVRPRAGQPTRAAAPCPTLATLTRRTAAS